MQIDFDLFDAPTAVSNLHLACDQGYDLAAGCPVSCACMAVITVFSAFTRIAADFYRACTLADRICDSA